MAAIASAEFQTTYCVRGYHVYRDMWDASVREPTYDRYAVAVKKSGTIVGYVVKRIS